MRIAICFIVPFMFFFPLAPINGKPRFGFNPQHYVIATVKTGCTMQIPLDLLKPKYGLFEVEFRTKEIDHTHEWRPFIVSCPAKPTFTNMEIELRNFPHAKESFASKNLRMLVNVDSSRLKGKAVILESSGNSLVDQKALAFLVNAGPFSLPRNGADRLIVKINDGIFWVDEAVDVPKGWLHAGTATESMHHQILR